MSGGPFGWGGMQTLPQEKKSNNMKYALIGVSLVAILLATDYLKFSASS